MPNLYWGTTDLYPGRVHTVLPGSTISLCSQGRYTELVMDQIAEHRRPHVRICPECAVAAVDRLFPAWPSPHPRQDGGPVVNLDLAAG
ncbi:hypothetical protein [Amycolatopsis sp. NPDC051128]|uniref:hypothetical protein n=1 Tax=Amycolatopsis sp. NPDC051128 TaxID=3155412 RepID=UPI00341CFFA2